MGSRRSMLGGGTVHRLRAKEQVILLGRWSYSRFYGTGNASLNPDYSWETRNTTVVPSPRIYSSPVLAADPLGCARGRYFDSAHPPDPQKQQVGNSMVAGLLILFGLFPSSLSDCMATIRFMSTVPDLGTKLRIISTHQNGISSRAYRIKSSKRDSVALKTFRPDELLLMCPAEF